MVRVNGEDHKAEGMTVKEFLEKEGYSLTRIAVERNGEIVPKATYEDTVLEENDKLEVVSFVGGG